MRFLPGAEMQLDDAATILARADFFEICDAEQRRLLAFASERKRFRPGEVVYKSGEVPDGAHVLVTGNVTMVADGDGPVVPRVVGHQGAILGAMALVVAKPRPVTVRAIDVVETLFVPRKAFLKLATQFPDLAERAAERIRRDLVDYVGAVRSVAGIKGD
jgi:CRP-like cAMP-binding protein